MIKFLYSSLILLLPLGLLAQTADLRNVSALRNADFLKSAWNSQSVLLRQKNLESFGDTSFRNPIENVELTLGKTYNTSDKREAALKISPRGFVEYSTWSKLDRQSAELEKMAFDQQLSSALFERYMMLTEYLALWEKQRLAKLLLELSQREFAMIRASSRASVAEAKDLMKANEELDNSRTVFDQASLNVTFAWKKLKALDSRLEGDPLPPEGLPTALEFEKMATRALGDTKSFQSVDSAMVKYAQEKATQARNSWKMEQSSKTKLIDSFEVKLAEDRKDKVYSVEVSVNLPGFGSDYNSREKLRRLVDYDVEALGIEKNSRLTLETARENLLRSIQSYKELTSEKNQKVMDRMKALARKQDPMLNILLEKENLAKKSRNIDAATLIFQNYFSYLHSFDLLVQRPQVNFISANWQEL